MKNATEYLFSYGTLQFESVQLETFGRIMKGYADVLDGFDKQFVTITDEGVLAASGESSHPIIRCSGNPKDQVEGVVLEITLNELAQADSYEVDDYKRISTQTRSGKTVWVYVAADE